MPRERTLFACQNCGYQTPKWLGRCPDCGQWESLVEERVAPPSKDRRASVASPDARPTPLAEITAQGEDRRSTGIGVRPRGKRIEVTADFTPDPGLMIAAATLIVGIVREVMSWPTYDLVRAWGGSRIASR